MNNKQREPFKEAKIPDWRIIERYNKDGKYNTYCGANERYNIKLFGNCFGSNCWCSIVWFN